MGPEVEDLIIPHVELDFVQSLLDSLYMFSECFTQFLLLLGTVSFR